MMSANDSKRTSIGTRVSKASRQMITLRRRAMTDVLIRSLSTVGLLGGLMVAARPLFIHYRMRPAFISQWPLVLRATDPTYLPNDPYICEMQVFSVRTLPVYANAALASLVGFDAALLLQQLLALSIAGIATWIIARRAFGASDLAALFGVLLILYLRPGHFGNGLEAIDSDVGMPREIAKAFCMLALAFWLTQRWALATV